ncbi:MAG: site-specific integrase [Bacteroidales bacterium]|nr:site-specific integrase [Bacteroidales bacterium]
MKATYQLVFNRKNKLNSEGKAPIEIRVTLNRKTAYFSTKIQIKPNEWNNNRLRVNSKHPNNIKINNYLYNKIAEIEEFELSEKEKGKTVIISDIKNFIKNKRNSISFPEWCLKMLEEDSIVNKSTNAKRKVLVRRLFKFNKDLQFNQIDYSFMLEFDNFLHREKTPYGNSLKQVTIHGQMKILRYFLNLAFKTQKISFVPDYKVKIGEIPKEALTEKELESIEKLKFHNNKILEKVRDIFLFSSYTALRFGDISKITVNNIRYNGSGEMELHFVMEKVNKPITIPIAKFFNGKPEKILNKYLKNNNNTIFEIPTNQSVNRNLKIIKEIAGIKKPLTFHISRHTCLTLIGKKTGNPYLVMKIAGHSDIKTSMKYTQGVIDNELFNLL